MIQVLSADQLRVQATALGTKVQKFLTDLEVGEGGLFQLPKEKVHGYGRPTVKSTIRAAAQALGQDVRFRRSPDDQVIFERVR